jgi:hypothetical protein
MSMRVSDDEGNIDKGCKESDRIWQLCEVGTMNINTETVLDSKEAVVDINTEKT